MPSPACLPPLSVSLGSPVPSPFRYVVGPFYAGDRCESTLASAKPKQSAAVRDGKQHSRERTCVFAPGRGSVRSVGRSSATLLPVLSFVAVWRPRAWVFRDTIMLDHLAHAASSRGRARPALHATRFARARMDTCDEDLDVHVRSYAVGNHNHGWYTDWN